MKSLWIEESMLYDGQQLVSRFAYMNYGLLGDSVVAWSGPCDIPTEHMVDGEDVLAGAAIRGGEMLHFIVEGFGMNLFSAVALQRLLAAIVKDELTGLGAVGLYRAGDDIFQGEKKLSISIATVSPISAMIHFAVNITNENTPVPTVSLNDMDVIAQDFAITVMSRLTREVASIKEATQKVNWVR
ncbi:MAG: DUF366 family protein [Pseudobdellovibrionaceae bacterium]|nr:DUF366 family protein [Bdellovibrionales bacterium]USN48672.1 MAG: DUF366 family protein [Pseudobdellovibrionaceae bacterium]